MSEAAPSRCLPNGEASSILDAAFDEHNQVAARACADLREPFARLVGVCADALRSGGKILLFGNGGSAGDAQHIATELVVRFVSDRPPIAALALTTDTSALTAIGNDMDFDAIFARQLAALGRPGDVAIGISTSGNSANVRQALEAADRIGMRRAALLGKDGGEIRSLADPALVVPSATTARIQEMHILIGHALCGALERELGYA